MLGGPVHGGGCVPDPKIGSRRMTVAAKVKGVPGGFAPRDERSSGRYRDFSEPP